MPPENVCTTVKSFSDVSDSNGKENLFRVDAQIRSLEFGPASTLVYYGCIIVKYLITQFFDQYCAFLKALILFDEDIFACASQRMQPLDVQSSYVIGPRLDPLLGKLPQCKARCCDELSSATSDPEVGTVRPPHQFEQALSGGVEEQDIVLLRAQSRAAVIVGLDHGVVIFDYELPFFFEISSVRGLYRGKNPLEPDIFGLHFHGRDNMPKKSGYRPEILICGGRG